MFTLTSHPHTASLRELNDGQLDHVAGGQTQLQNDFQQFAVDLVNEDKALYSADAQDIAEDIDYALGR
jgi:hypothetical protein